MDTNTELYHDVPCSSIAVESIISVGTGGLIWGLCSGSYDAKQKGLFAGIFSFTRCGIRRYRKKSDWVNALVAGGVAGAAIGAGTRNWRQVAVMTAFLSGFCAIADQSRAI
ncbi:outer envelope pore protein 16-4, chloroplastic isoform X2 [Helianthus annuus]|uniref:outer envelope pore protein 16-4, chloroplastic isoform X2 n=1 Tax=Helianthus annuus TaxID=4232 RepID=UPI000B90A3CB|nr:outer envelope pore protein 16-4, chloroplastic isoform X2 [Helianthus annuus]